MSDPNSLMAASFATQSMGTIGNTYNQSQALKAQGDYQKGIGDINARYAEYAATDAIERGDKDATEFKKKTKSLIGSQRAALAAQGIEVNSGSALEIQEDTRRQAEIEAIGIKNNAWREAWGYRQQATQATAAGQMAQITSRQQANNTIVTGGLQATGQGLQAIAYSKKK